MIFSLNTVLAAKILTLVLKKCHGKIDLSLLHVATVLNTKQLVKFCALPMVTRKYLASCTVPIEEEAARTVL